MDNQLRGWFPRRLRGTETILFQRVVYKGSAKLMDGTEVHGEPAGLLVIVPVRIHIRFHLGLPEVPFFGVPFGLSNVVITPSLVDYHAAARVTVRLQCMQLEGTRVRVSRETVTVELKGSHMAPLEPPGVRDGLDHRVRDELRRQFSEAIDAELARRYG